MIQRNQDCRASHDMMFVKLSAVVFVAIIMLVMPNMKVCAEGDQVFFSGTGELTEEYVDSHLGDATEVVVSGFSEIGYGAFQNKSNITKVSIQDSVIAIGNIAFYGCSSLTSITIPDSVISIGWRAFEGCSSLTNVIIPDSVTTIGQYAFAECNSLTKITIPNSVTNMEYNVFSDCPGLVTAGPIGGEFNIEFGWTGVMPDDAFAGCNNLTSVTIPNSITSIGDGSFFRCSSLTNVVISNSVTKIGSSAFDECSSLTSVTIPDSVTFIDCFAFEDCISLSNVVIPDSVTFIGNSAFRGCSSLKGVTISNSVTCIDSCVFKDCRSLTNVAIPKGVTFIHSAAFDGCSSLSAVTIPNSVNAIGACAFRGCSSLANIPIPCSVYTMDRSSLDECNNITINGYSGSIAEWVANYLGIPFVSMGRCEMVYFDNSNLGGYISDDNVEINGCWFYAVGEPYAWFPSVVTDSGYKFLGWFLDKEGTQRVSEDVIFDGENDMLFAKWEEAGAHFSKGEEDKYYWYENGIRQGTYDDPKGVIGNGTVRGREIYDPASDGWYWLDAVYDGAKACNKEVWMPYIYQNEASWGDAEIEMNANNSGSMKQQVINFIKNRDGKWVRYDADGKMVKGWYTVEGDDEKIYPEQIGNTYYYDYQTGLMAKGWQTIEGQDYYFDETTGVLVK